MPERFRIALLGHGTVGAAFAELLEQRAQSIEHVTGLRPELSGVLTRSRGDFDDLLETSDLVVEVIGGIEPAREYVLRALRAGRHVVTANKQLLSQHGEELWAAAREHGVQLRYEASVAGVVPVIRVLNESLGAAHIDRIHGIVNGTTNFVLTAMARGGLTYEAALAQAQELGYAEADPTEDVGGADAAAKMAILSSIAFHSRVRLDDVPYEGIDRLEAEDLERAESLGFVVKLLGVARLHDGAMSVRVHPALVPRGHRLAAVAGPDNAVLLESRATGEIMLVGPGAGGDETASAVVADVLSILGTHQGSFLHNALADAGRPVLPPHEVRSAFYVRMSVADRPGVLARVASAFAEEHLSIRTVVQSGAGDEARLVMVLHEGPEGRMRAAVARMAGLEEVRGEPVVLRVVGSGVGEP